MRTTDDILKDLRKRETAGEDVRQEIISHEALARLRTELTTFDHASDWPRVRGIESQINVHKGLISEDVDERVAVRPDKDSVAEVPELEPAKRPRPVKHAE